MHQLQFSLWALNSSWLFITAFDVSGLEEPPYSVPPSFPLPNFFFGHPPPYHTVTAPPPIRLAAALWPSCLFFRQKPRAHCRATRNRLHPHEGQTYGTRHRPPQQSTTFSNSIGGGEENRQDGHSAADNRSSRRTLAQGIQERVESGLLDYFFVARSEQNLVHKPSKRSKEDFLSSSLWLWSVDLTSSESKRV